MRESPTRKPTRNLNPPRSRRPKKRKPRPVHLHNGCPDLSVPIADTQRVFHHLDNLAAWPAPEGALSVAFLTRENMCRVHSDFLQDDRLTDVITFEGTPEAGIAGEICVAPVQALEFKGPRRLPFAEELTLYLVHGYLHLAGLDDLDPAGRRRMRIAERRAMDHLRSVDAIPDFNFRKS